MSDKPHPALSAGDMPLVTANRQKLHKASAQGLTFLDILAFLVPTVKFFEVDLVGRLFGSDILLLVLLPFLLARRGRVLTLRLPKLALMLGFVWFFGQVLSDVIRQTPFEDYTRGWAKISFLLINFTSLFLLLWGSHRRIVLYAVGLAAGGVLSFYVNPNEYASAYPWKFGIGSSVTFGIILLATYFYQRRPNAILFPVLLLLFATLLNFSLGFRSIGGMVFLAAGFVALQYTLTSGRRRRRRLSPVSIAFVAMAGLMLVTLILQLYSMAAQNGTLGLEAQNKYEMQSAMTGRFGPWGLILGGRTESLASIKAIANSPIIGNGSWAKNQEYVSQMYDTLRRLGFRVNDYAYEQALAKGLIPSHSHFFGAWVEAGIFGAIFWFWALRKTGQAMLRLVGRPHSLTPLLAYMGISFIWTILFSPLGADGRMTSAALLAIMLMVLTEFDYSKGKAVKYLAGVRINR